MADEGYVDVPMIRLIYPAKKLVPVATVLGWAKDAYRSGDTETDPSTIQEAIAILEDLGYITVVKGDGNG